MDITGVVGTVNTVGTNVGKEVVITVGTNVGEEVVIGVGDDVDTTIGVVGVDGVVGCVADEGADVVTDDGSDDINFGTVYIGSVVIPQAFVPNSIRIYPSSPQSSPQVFLIFQ